MHNTLKKVAFVVGSLHFIPALTILVVTWICVNAIPGTGHFDPFPFPLLLLTLIFLVVVLASIFMHQMNRTVELVHTQHASYSKTWQRLDNLYEQLDILAMNNTKVLERLETMASDYERSTEILFEMRNMFVAHKNQNSMMNERLIAIAKEAEQLSEYTEELKKMLGHRRDRGT